MDTDGERHFSALFYVDLLANMGVRLVVWLSHDIRQRDVATLEEHGLAVCLPEDLRVGCTDPTEPFSLQSIRRFVEICRHAKGPVAVAANTASPAPSSPPTCCAPAFATDAEEAASWICIARGAAAPRRRQTTRG
jgi:hypothetical protein